MLGPPYLRSVSAAKPIYVPLLIKCMLNEFPNTWKSMTGFSVIDLLEIKYHCLFPVCL